MQRSDTYTLTNVMRQLSIGKTLIQSLKSETGCNLPVSSLEGLEFPAGLTSLDLVSICFDICSLRDGSLVLECCFAGVHDAFNGFTGMQQHLQS
jgi:hypothetical protein